MTIENINIADTLKGVEDLLKQEKDLSPASRAMFEVLVLVITLLVNRLGLNSKNSSKPPSSDPNRKKTTTKNKGNKIGGQDGHQGTTLQKIDNPDITEFIKLDRRTLPRGDYKDVGYESRQVFDIDISRIVTEYQAQILEDKNGKQFTAPFPDDVSKAVQYGKNIKAHSVYMSQFQLIPYNRIQDYFQDQLQIPISTGTLFNFNKEAYGLLEDFEQKAKNKLAESPLIHADETGININGKRLWLHCASSLDWTFFGAHQKRGKAAMDHIGILPLFSGILCHDHWKPYYKYSCSHALCNAHHLRELTRAWEQDSQHWAKDMKALLEKINRAVNDAGGALGTDEVEGYQQEYKAILKAGDQESPPPDEAQRKGKRGRIKKTKARNLLERLRDYEDDTLLFMKNMIVPFTNNLGENDLRMTKVQQKISGCFRSIDGAHIFCRVRSYLSTCRKQGFTSSHALSVLFEGKYPNFKQ